MPLLLTCAINNRTRWNKYLQWNITKEKENHRSETLNNINKIIKIINTSMKDTICPWVGKLNIMKMIIQSKDNSRLNTIHTKITITMLLK